MVSLNLSLSKNKIFPSSQTSPQWLAYSKDSPPESITKPMQKLVEILADKQALIAKSLALVLEKITTSLDQPLYEA